MKKTISVMIAALAAGAWAEPKAEWIEREKAVFAAQPEKGRRACWFDIGSDKPGAIAKCGEPVEFEVRTLYMGGEESVPFGDVSVKVTNFGRKILAQTVYNLETCQVFKVSVKLDEPGFISCSCIRKSVVGQQEWGSWTVGVEPERIGTASERPADFDRFWDEAIASLDKTTPIDVQVEKVDRYSSADFASYCIGVASFNGRRTWGYLSLPTKPGKYPVRINVPGAGQGWTGFRKGGAAIFLTMNVFDFKYDWNDGKRHKELYDDMLKRWETKYRTRNAWGGLWQAGIGVSREEYFYYGAILGINRILNWVCTEPKEVFAEGVTIDRAKVDYSGQSQGGAFGLFLAGLNTNITSAVISEPALTGLLFDQKDMAAGWPYVVVSQTSPEAKANARKFASYFDGAHFAPRIRCKVRMGAGFTDGVCPPHCIYSAYNALGRDVDRHMTHGLGCSHGGPRGRYNEYEAMLGDWNGTFRIATITADRAKARYACGETATFRIRPAFAWGKGTVTLSDADGKAVAPAIEVDCAKQKEAVVSGKLDKPGTLRVRFQKRAVTGEAASSELEAVYE